MDKRLKGFLKKLLKVATFYETFFLAFLIVCLLMLKKSNGNDFYDEESNHRRAKRKIFLSFPFLQKLILTSFFLVLPIFQVIRFPVSIYFDRDRVFYSVGRTLTSMYQNTSIYLMTKYSNISGLLTSQEECIDNTSRVAAGSASSGGVRF